MRPDPRRHPVGASRRPWLWRALAIVPAYVFASYVINWSIPLSVRVEAALVLLATMVRPGAGLIAVALLAPLGEAVVPLIGAPPFRHAETLVVAFLAEVAIVAGAG